MTRPLLARAAPRSRSGTTGPKSTGPTKNGRNIAMGMYVTIVSEGGLPEGPNAVRSRVPDKITVSNDGRVYGDQGRPVHP
jgi:hypothetical protein